MIAWLWDAGPSWCGVSGSADGAREAAGKVLRKGDAAEAVVEAATVAVGGWGLATVHERTGTAWRARVDRRGRVRWSRCVPGRAAP